MPFATNKFAKISYAVNALEWPCVPWIDSDKYEYYLDSRLKFIKDRLEAIGEAKRSGSDQLTSPSMAKKSKVWNYSLARAVMYFLYPKAVSDYNMDYKPLAWLLLLGGACWIRWLLMHTLLSMN